MWNICLKRLSYVICSRRTLTTNNNSIIDNAIKYLSINYKKELDQLELNENSMERMHYLKTTLQTMNKREKILQDINETNKLSHGNNKTQYGLSFHII